MYRKKLMLFKQKSERTYALIFARAGGGWVDAHQIVKTLLY
jgi:hypothetical protein